MNTKKDQKENVSIWSSLYARENEEDENGKSNHQCRTCMFT